MLIIYVCIIIIIFFFSNYSSVDINSVDIVFYILFPLEYENILR